MINMEEMIILNRELTTQTTWLSDFVGLFILFMAINCGIKAIVSIKMDKKEKGRLFTILFIAFLGAVILVDEFNVLEKPVERIEVIGYFEDFQKKIENRGYEVVERRGDIVVLERKYKQ